MHFSYRIYYEKWPALACLNEFDRFPEIRKI
jgi:hypothetical protein